ncbi:MAG: hypothetical protein ACYC9R_12850 [Nitrosotalea sp.]
MAKVTDEVVNILNARGYHPAIFDMPRQEKYELVRHAMFNVIRPLYGANISLGEFTEALKLLELLLQGVF